MAEKADKTASPPHPLRVAVAVLAAPVIAWLLLSSPTFEIPGKTIECDPIQPLLPGRVSTYDSETYDSDATREAAIDSEHPSTYADRSAGRDRLQDVLLHRCDMARERRQTMIIMTATGALALMLLLPAHGRAAPAAAAPRERRFRFGVHPEEQPPVDPGV